LAPQVAVVILDYAGEITPNIEWELRTLLHYCAPEKIVIAMSEQVSAEGHAMTLLEPHGELCRIVGVSRLPQVFVYANRVPITTITSKYEAVVRPAQRIIGIAALTPVNQSVSAGSLDSPAQYIH
jgi:hypothetical protein